MAVGVLTLSPCQASTDSRAAIQISSRKTSSRKTSKPYFCNHQFRSEADRCEVLASFVLSSHGGSLRCGFNNRRLVQLGLSFRTRVAPVGERFMPLRRVHNDLRCGRESFWALEWLQCQSCSSRSNPSSVYCPAQPIEVGGSRGQSFVYKLGVLGVVLLRVHAVGHRLHPVVRVHAVGHS